MVQEEHRVQLRWGQPGWLAAPLHGMQVGMPPRQHGHAVPPLTCMHATPTHLPGVFELNNHSDWRIWRNSLPDNQLGGFMK